MAYSRAEYHREVNRDVEEPKQGGWKSWFGLGDNKDRDEERDRGYNYQSTTTYRTQPHPSQFGGYGDRERFPERTAPWTSGYAGARGGYGYTSSDEVTRPSWNTDRDYQTRPSYGQTTGERDSYYSKEARTYGGYGGDRDWTSTRHTTTGGDYHPTRYTTGGDYTPSYTPSRGYGFGGEYTTTPRDYTTSTRDYPTTYPTTTGSRYPVTGGDYPTHGPFPSRGYGFERDTTYTRNYPETSSRTYGGYTGGYGGDSYTRPSYQQSSYRY